MIRRPPRSTHCISSAASDVYKRQVSKYPITTNAIDIKHAFSIVYSRNDWRMLEISIPASPAKKYAMVCSDLLSSASTASSALCRPRGPRRKRPGPKDEGRRTEDAADGGNADGADFEADAGGRDHEEDALDDGIGLVGELGRQVLESKPRNKRRHVRHSIIQTHKVVQFFCANVQSLDLKACESCIFVRC
eukprot:TRINITY_DN4523_c0_g1_i4.p1 TRINITY_DN4523_c0_g1~~TRINITY_DN4523_c0_g1_i4.p1  ORF type:complete len:199 (-),score=17.59 TRINITY_DN4523_c0_g1_i4:142-714(-)